MALYDTGSLPFSLLLQVAVHAIGDRAVDEAIDAFEAASANSSSSRLQHRIEHVQHISSPAAAARMAAAGLSGVPNPQHLLSDWPLLLPKLGVHRSGPGRAFAFKTLSEAGVVLGSASDWPVVEVDPWASVYAAVYRREPPSSSSSDDVIDLITAAAAAGGDENVGGEGIDVGETVGESEGERLGLSEVLLGHTLHAARVARLDQWVGQLAFGQKADFIVLDANPFSDSSPFAAAGGGGGGGGSGSGGSGGLPIVQQTYMDGVCVYGCDESAAVVAE
jgi:predicted amidohydrolase YtcJ